MTTLAVRRFRLPSRPTTFKDIMARGVMGTPGLVIDGKVVSAGRIPSAGDISAGCDPEGVGGVGGR